MTPAPNGSKLGRMSKGTERLARMMERQGMSERDAAAILGCSRSALNRYLRGERAWPSRVLHQIQTVYGIEPAAFFKGGKTT